MDEKCCLGKEPIVVRKKEFVEEGEGRGKVCENNGEKEKGKECVSSSIDEFFFYLHWCFFDEIGKEYYYRNGEEKKGEPDTYSYVFEMGEFLLCVVLCV